MEFVTKFVTNRILKEGTKLLKIDSISRKVPLEKVQIKTNETPNIKPIISGDTGELLAEKRQYREGIGFGLNSFITDKVRGSAEIGLSAKILGAEYFDGITKENVQKVSDNLKKIGVFEVSDQALLSSEVHKLDVTENLKPENRTVPDVLGSLQNGMLNTKFRVQSYKANRVQTGIEFNPMAKSNNTRLIAYSKFEDLTNRSKMKKHSEFFNSMGADFNNLIEKSRGVLRVETNLRSHKRIKQYLGVEKDLGVFDLENVLSSKANPNHIIATEIFKPQTHIDLVGKYRGETIGTWLKNIGRETIAIRCNYDMDLIRKQFEIINPCRKRWAQHKKWFLANIPTIKEEQGIQFRSEDIREFLKMLKEVA